MRRELFLIALLLVPQAGWAQRPPLRVPTDAATVIERLPRGYAALEPSIVESITPAPDLGQVRRLLRASAASGDTRLAARADAMLLRFPADDPSVELLRLQAFSAQHRHDFTGALRLLNQLIARAPRDGNARLARAEINLVQGRIDQARRDCTALALGIDADRGLLCVASLSLRTGRFDTAARILDQLLQPSAGSDDRLFTTLMRAEVAARAGDNDADDWYQQALAMAPGDVRTMASYARYLRHVGRDIDVEALLGDAILSDTLELQRTLAAYSAGRGNARQLIQSQARRYAVAHAAGMQPEMRDEAEFLLTLRKQPEAALALAVRNFQQQRDHEDVDILARAAQAAGRLDALKPLQDWADSQGLRLTVTTEPVP